MYLNSISQVEGILNIVNNWRTKIIIRVKFRDIFNTFLVIELDDNLVQICCKSQNNLLYLKGYV